MHRAYRGPGSPEAELQERLADVEWEVEQLDDLVRQLAAVLDCQAAGERTTAGSRNDCTSYGIGEHRLA